MDAIMDDAPVPVSPFAWLGRREGLLLLVLLAVTLGLRGWQLTSIPVATRDSIAFIRLAWYLEQRPLTEALRSQPHHPLYPLAILGMSKVFRPLTPDNLPQAMERSALAVNGLVSVVLVVVMYYLGRELFNPAIGFVGALLFQLLPATGRLLGDALSEPLFYLLAALALLAATKGLRQGSLGWLAATGGFSALAYLTRPEGMLIAVVTIGVGIIHQRMFIRCFVVAACFLLLAGPYMLTIGGLTAKPSAAYFVDPEKWQRDDPGRAAMAAPLPLAAWESDWGKQSNDPSRRWGWAACILVLMFNRAFFHGLWAFLFLALFHQRLRLRRDPALLTQLILGCLMLLLCYRVAQSNGYLSDRHLSLVVLMGVYWVALGLAHFALWFPHPDRAALVVLVLVGGIAGYRTTRPMHAERVAFRTAGEWLAEHTLPGDRILDPYAHVYFYSGRIFVDERRGDVPASNPVRSYVVLEHSSNSHPHLHHLLQHAEVLAQRGVEVVRVPLTRKAQPGYLAIYEVAAPLPRNVGG
jgi:hypothetical protein